MTGETRRLAAIVAADVAGYSRLMGADEEGTIAALRGHRAAVIEPKLAEFHGRIANTAGDSFLIEFSSAVDALRCAIDIQAGIAARNADIPEDRRLVLRIGINVGDVVANGDDLLGDGVNVAARLEALADSGGICLSRSARDQVRDRLDIALEDLGEIEVKNIARPVRAFRVAGLGSAASSAIPAKRPRAVYAALAVVLAAIAAGGIWWSQQERAVSTAADALSPDKPSIAVLPFSNVSGDEDQAYFADGITEDITTDLSKVAGLYVTSRSATLRYRDKDQDPKVIAAALRVRHILTGSVRRAGQKLRITASLMDTRTGGQLWAERFDRDTQDVFAIQDEIADRVVSRLSATLTGVTLNHAKRTYTPDVRAYDAYIRGRATRIPPTPANLAAALKLYRKAIEIDPKFSGGYAGASFVEVLLYSETRQTREEAAKHMQDALQLAQKAVELDPTFGPAWGSLAEARFRNGEFDAAVSAIERAVAVAPSDALMRARYGRILGHVDRAADGVAEIRRAIRMSPDNLPFAYFLGATLRADGQFEKAVEALLDHRRRLGGRIAPAPTAQLVAAYAQSGQTDKAASEAARLLERAKGYTVERAARTHNYKSAAQKRAFADALIKAGIPAS